MNKKNIDLSDIKENDLDKTSSFTDLMTRKERKNREKIKDNFDDIEEMISEKKKSTKDLTKDLEKAKKEYKKEFVEEQKIKVEKEDKESKEDNFGKTQILELTRQMKFNFEEKKEVNNKNKKHGMSVLNIIGEINLLCIGYYIYLLVFTSYQDQQQNYLITGFIIVLLVLLFGLSVITGKKSSKVFNVLNILAIIGFITFNAYTLLY